MNGKAVFPPARFAVHACHSRASSQHLSLLLSLFSSSISLRYCTPASSPPNASITVYRASFLMGTHFITWHLDQRRVCNDWRIKEMQFFCFLNPDGVIQVGCLFPLIACQGGWASERDQAKYNGKSVEVWKWRNKHDLKSFTHFDFSFTVDKVNLRHRNSFFSIKRNEKYNKKMYCYVNLGIPKYSSHILFGPNKNYNSQNLTLCHLVSLKNLK